MNPDYRFGLFLMAILFIQPNWGYNQTFFKQLREPEKFTRQKIVRFSNGDLLIGDAEAEGQLQDNTAAVFLTRMNGCGNVSWSYSYRRSGLELRLKDMLISEEDQIFVSGITLDGLRENIFLLEVDGEGAEKRFKTFESPTAGTSNFSISMRDEQILICGRILDISFETTGYIALFDKRLNLLWAKRIAPFTAEGSAIITAEGKILVRTEALHYLFDAEGNSLWAKIFDRSLDPVPIAGPLEITGGYLFQALHQDQTFFYKLDETGKLIWKSNRFSSNKFPATIEELQNGDLLIFNMAPETQGNSLEQLTLSGAGEAVRQLSLIADYSMNIGSVFHSMGPGGKIIVLGNPDALQSIAADLGDFLIQFDENEATACFFWQEREDWLLNEYPLAFPEMASTESSLMLNLVVSGGLEVQLMEDPFTEICGETNEPEIIVIDTLLQCKEAWDVKLPSEDFTWFDGYPSLQRRIDNTGSYRAKNSDCVDPLIYEFQLERLICDCEIFVPTAFSPNGDGINDHVSIYSDCQLMNIKTSIYDRWGNLLHTSQGEPNLWDGLVFDQKAPSGVYIILVNLQLLSASGGIEETTLSRDILLVR